MYNVIVLCNGDVFAVWTADLVSGLDHTTKTEIRNLVMEKVRELDPHGSDKWTVQFTDHLPCDNMSQLFEAIKTSLENEIGF